MEVLREELDDGRVVLLLPEVDQAHVADLLADQAARNFGDKRPSVDVTDLLAIWWLGGVDLDGWERWASCRPGREPVELPTAPLERAAVFHAERWRHSGYRLAAACCAVCPVAPECLAAELDALPASFHGFRAALGPRPRQAALVAARAVVDGTRTVDVPDAACTGRLRLRSLWPADVRPAQWAIVHTAADVAALVQRTERAAAERLELVPVGWLLAQLDQAAQDLQRTA